LKFGSGSIFFRKALVVFQFALSMILITAMIVVYRQVEYIQSKNLGYDRDNLIYVPIEGELVKNYSVFKQKALSIPGIENISKMRNSPTVIEHHTGSIEWAGKPSEQTVSFADGVVGYDFVNTMKLTLVEGRDFSKDFGTDSAGYLLNETAASRIGFKNPVGETVAWGNRPGKIIGVLKDFHFASMQQSIDPLIIRLDENWGWGTILVRARAGKTKSVIAGLEQLCKSLNPKIPFSFQFSDAAFANLYRSEQTVSKLSGYFSLLAILISCLGLFGLVTFAASQRTREIGIRKVLGASTASISQLLSQDFLRLILLAIVIAAPIAWWVMSMWLDNYVYRVPMNGWTIATAALIASLIAAATIASQAVKAAIANPVKSLRSE
jgi:ABC-type antimicrobial peptide transport system permease subunit